MDNYDIESPAAVAATLMRLAQSVPSNYSARHRAPYEIKADIYNAVMVSRRTSAPRHRTEVTA